MRKETVVIGASEESVYAISVAQKRGYRVTAFDGNPAAKGLVCADEAIVTDIRDVRQIVSRMKTRPDFVLPVPIGRYLISAGALNDELGLKGISWQAADICTDKYKLHSRLSHDGLRAGSCFLIEAGQTPDVIPGGGIPADPQAALRLRQPRCKAC